MQAGERENPDALIPALEFAFAEIHEIARRFECGGEILGEDETLFEILHHGLEPECGVHDIADDRRIALCDEADVAAGDRAEMERHPHAEWTRGPRPDALLGGGEEFLGNGERDPAFASLRGAVLRLRPVGEDRVADELVDRVAGDVHGVARLRKPSAQGAGQRVGRHGFRDGAEAADVADENRHALRRGFRAGIRGGDGEIAEAAAGIGFLRGFEMKFRAGDADDTAPIERDRGDDALLAHVSAIAAAEIHDLVLHAIEAADERMLPRDAGIPGEADRIFRRAPDRGSVADQDFLRRSIVPGDDTDSGWHG